MKISIAFLCLLLGSLSLPAAERTWEPLPIAVSGNTVAAQKISKTLFLFSFMGIGEKKTWNAVTNRAFSMDTETGKWNELRPVPGPAGRLDASAVATHDVVYLLGGYTLDARGDETSVRSVEMLLPSRGVWYRGEDMPIPLDNTLVGQYRDRFIYTIGGRSQGAPVRKVQVYDSEKNSWAQATPLEGIAVFGHAGTIVDDTILYIDGAQLNPAGNKPRYVPVNECWMGKIDHKDPAKIHWSKLPNHPGTARYQIAASSEHDHRIYFSGGSEVPYNYAGITDSGAAAEASPVTFAWNLKTSKWEVISEKTANATMGTRELLGTSHGLVRIGGLETGQKVTPNVTMIPRK
jgi:N-acetylneuraminic acid mutarotase